LTLGGRLDLLLPGTPVNDSISEPKPGGERIVSLASDKLKFWAKVVGAVAVIGAAALGLIGNFFSAKQSTVELVIDRLDNRIIPALENRLSANEQQIQNTRERLIRCEVLLETKTSMSPSTMSMLHSAVPALSLPDTIVNPQPPSPAPIPKMQIDGEKL
jgi:hypothetical protein